MVVTKKLKLWIKKGVNKIKPYVISFGSIFLIITAYQKLGKYGLLGMLGIILFIILIRGRRIFPFYMNTLRRMESEVFGKPLDKELWKKGELKQYKIKFGWKSKKEKDGGKNV